MTAEEWLLSARGINDEIKELEISYRRALERATNVTVAPMGERVMYTPKNTSEEKMIEASEYAMLIAQSLNQKKQLRKDVFRAIDEVHNSTLRRLLRLYYIEGLSWESVAEEMGMSDKHVRETLKERAILRIEKIRERLAL